MNLQFSAKLEYGGQTYPVIPDTSPQELLCYNPVDEHLIALRSHSEKLSKAKNKHMQELRKLKNLYESEGKTEELKKALKEFIKLKGIKTKKIKNAEKEDGKKQEGEKENPTEDASIIDEKKGCIEGENKGEKRKKRRHKKSTEKKSVSAYSVPRFPLSYPFQKCVNQKLSSRHLFKTEHKVLFQGLLHEKSVAKFLHHFVKSVIVESGFTVTEDQKEGNDDVVALLIDLTNMFLKTFVFILHRNTVFSNNLQCTDTTQKERDTTQKEREERDLWGPLESTLEEIGFCDGINQLHRFYYEKIVKKHDILLKTVRCRAHRVHNLEELSKKLTYMTSVQPCVKK